ncbi:fibronectin type III domain-containing protein, partial [Flavobacterium qiangtangense]
MKKITLLLLMCFSSFLGYSQLSEGFDNSTVNPSGGTWALTSGSWAIFDNGVGTQVSWAPTTSPALVHQGTRAVQMNGTVDNLGIGNTSEDWLVTPAVVVPNNGQLKFFTRLQTAGNQGSIFEIRVSTTSQTNASSFTTIKTWNELDLNAVYNQYEEKTVSLGLTAGTTVYVAFVLKNTQVTPSPSSERWLIDTVNIVEQCLDPTGLYANGVTQNSANLGWLNPSGATSWEIEILPGTAAVPTTHSGITYNGLLPYAATTTAYGSPLTQTAFTPNTEYKYYVRALCTGSGTSSAWVGPFTFTTGAPGFTCSSAISVTGLPYSTTDNTTNYGDTTDVNQGTNCGSATNYMTGNDVFYSYTATETGVINISMTPGNAASTFTGLFVYNGCSNVGVSCIAGVANAAVGIREIPALAVTAGQTYIIVISTNAAPQTAAYTLVIQKVNCTPPTNLNAINVTQTAATLTWDNPGNLASVWQVALQDAGAPIPTGAGVDVTTNTAYQPGVLLDSHAYQYYVRAQCPDGTYSAWAGPFLFNTLQVPATVPFVEGFEGTNTFALNNGNQVNKWAVGTATNNGGTKALYISNNNGVANAYTLTTAVTAQAYRDIAIPAGTGELNLSFDWKAVGESTFDYIRVWAVPASFTPVIGTQITAGAGRIQIGANLNASANYTNVNFVVPATTFAGQTMRLVFEWRNDGSGGTQPPAAIDNINLTVITCSAPSAPVVQTVGQDNATVGWTAPANGGGSYQYYYSTTNTAPVATTAPTGTAATTSAPLTELTPSTTYYFWVRTDCGANGTSTWTGPLSISTTQIPGTLTYTDGFEGTPAWTILNGNQINKWVIGTATSNGGTQSLYISNTNGTTNAYALPSTSTVHAYRDLTIPATANELNVAFDWRAVGESTFDYIRVWAVPTSFVPTPGTQIAAGAGRVQLGGNLNASATYATANYVLPTTGFAGQTMRLVFEWRNDASGGTQPPGAIDNVNINVITCSAPSALIVNTAGQTTAGISWTPPTGGAASYDYYVSTTNVPPTTTSTVVNVTTPNATLQGLSPSTTYYVWVRSNCGVDGTSTWTGPVQVITTQIPAQLNFIEGFEGPNTWTLNNGTQVNKWIVGTATSNGGTQSLYISNNNAANAYTLGSTSVVHAYRDIQMPAVVGDLSLSFDWKAVGEGFTTTFYDYMRVWAVPTTFNPVPGTQITAGPGRVQIGANFNNSAPWLSPNFIFPATGFAGQTMRLVFEWRNDGSGGAQPPAAVDNINLSQLTCPAPINLLASSNTNNSNLELTWTPVGTETQWEVVVQVAGSGAPVTPTATVNGTPSYTFTPQTGVFYEFYVRAICSPTDSSFWAGPSAFSVYSPPGCASVDLIGVGVDIVDQEIILCAEEDNCVDLSANYFGIGATTSYDVAPIAYNPPFPFTGGTPMNISTDDIWSPVINLPFNFCFFGENYSTAQVGSNGLVTFTPQAAPGFCPWQFNGQTIPNTAFPIKNAIYGVYQDLNPATPNTTAPVSINYQVLGTYPCRALVVNFSNVLQFQCGAATGPQTSQIVIYEISNIIEVYVQRREPCNGWPTGANGGQGVIGIQNTAGTLAYSPAGRNTGNWSAVEEAYRFSPTGASNVDFQWLKNGEFFSNSQDIQVCVTELTEMVAQATYETCGGQVVTVESQVTIRTTEPLPTNDPVDIVSCSTTGNPIFDLTPNTATIIGSNPATDIIIEYYLTQEAADLGDSSAAIPTPEAYAGTPGQTIFVRISYPGSNCFFVKTFQLQLGSSTPSVTTFSYATPVCTDATNPLPIPVTGFSAGGTFASTDVTVNPTTGEIDLSTATSGTHDVTYTLLPTGCNEGGSFTAQITINALPVADVMTDVTVCDSYTLLPLSANNGYFTEPNGGGQALPVGTVLNTTQTVYIYTSSGTSCSDQSQFLVTINQSTPVVTNFSYTAVCIAETSNPLPIPASGFTTGGSYASSTVTVDPVTGQVDLSSATVGTHDVTYTIAPSGCNTGGSFTTQITVNALPVADVIADVEMCDSFTLLPLTANNGYFTQPNGGGQALPAGTVLNTTQTVYVFASTGGTCSDESQFQVSIIESPVVSVTGACQGSNYIIEATIINENLSEDDFTFTWTDSDGTVVGNASSVTVTTSGNYLVTVVPKVVSTVNCGVDELFEANGTTCLIPKGISPNGDGKNDNFDLSGLQVRKISIFNRYGKIVYEFSNYTN